MATEALPPTPLRARNFLNTRQGRVILENLTAYLFLAPAGLIIFLFALFPVGFAFFVSLHRWRRFPDDYRGLDNYYDAVGNFAYVIFFWIALGALYFAVQSALRLYKETKDDKRGLLFILPGLVMSGAIFASVNWFFLLLLKILDVPQRLRGQESSTRIFVDEMLRSFRFHDVLSAANTMLIAVGLTIAVLIVFMRLIKSSDRGHFLFIATFIFTALGSSILLMQLTMSEVNIAIDEAREAGESLGIWTNVILISSGVLLLYLAYRLWQYTSTTYEDGHFVLSGLAVILLIIGGFVLVSELPRALSEADDDVLQGFSVTVMYAVFSVPMQLALGLGLSILLFQNIKGKSFFRLVYFMPYITPFVATSLVFTLIFAQREASPANTLITFLGGDARPWLTETDGIFELITGRELSGFLKGPSLALFVIIIFNVWVYAGYSTVIFLAGLGNIPKELYEAARIDGANGWRVFRHITFPLLSPTTFFLVLIATIGTFQAFTQIFLLRQQGAYDAVDTINLYIYQEVQNITPDYGYGSAMAFVLFAVILLLTVFQNRLLGRKVFYG